MNVHPLAGYQIPKIDPAPKLYSLDFEQRRTRLLESDERGNLTCGEHASPGGDEAIHHALALAVAVSVEQESGDRRVFPFGGFSTEELPHNPVWWSTRASERHQLGYSGVVVLLREPAIGIAHDRKPAEVGTVRRARDRH